MSQIPFLMKELMDKRHLSAGQAAQLLANQTALALRYVIIKQVIKPPDNGTLGLASDVVGIMLSGSLAGQSWMEHTVDDGWKDGEPWRDAVVSHATTDALIQQISDMLLTEPEDQKQKSELEKAQDSVKFLAATLQAEREAIARFLVPWRGRLSDSWLTHFEESCGVYFDAIGYVKPRPVELKAPPKHEL